LVVNGILFLYNKDIDKSFGGALMKLSEKIVISRKANGMTQEDLALLCKVSRQSISKWEADIALPETDKLLVLGEIFHVSMDVLLKDELMLNGVNDIQSCGNNAILEKKSNRFEGVLIKESIADDSILDIVNIHKIEIWNAGGKPKYWTVLYFTSNRKDFPEQISKVMLSDSSMGVNWFVDFKAGNEKYIVFRDKILQYQIGNQEEKDAVCNECLKLGILAEQMHWSE